ncbi:hypothetical protein LTR78_005914 [Recurvomyces mirabilis]|uniref:C2 domain-containing protein n=1 Tax=Recurvomyces mirabilis TaxID=574656 RepID=A0AAE0WLU2_9PEZI|nr:hypothetical protein LTR78_005914 [Recurvomyces mirabilis]KAK5155276.1 hypothetical protein LTS14_006231 [Recurvomyces mirabilis]
MSSSDLPDDLLGYVTPPSHSSYHTPQTMSGSHSTAHSVVSTDNSPRKMQSERSSLNSRRTNSYGTNTHTAGTSGRRGDMRRNMSYASTRHKAPITDHEAYLYTLRTAYLSYLLQPRQKRVQHVANTSKRLERTNTSINDLMADFKLIRDSKSTRFPHGFMGELDKRITNVLIGKEKGAEFQDPVVKRTFANFLNAFKEPQFRKQMDKDRRVEDLLLIFYSRATSELQKGKSAEDDAWKWMVDRHVALFVRLISSTLSQNDWTRDRPELSSRLKTLESKLLQHDQDLAEATQRAGGQGGQSIEVEIPRSFEVRDMPLVIRVCSIFAIPTVQAQNDILAHREVWTEQAALRDLKDYQNHMMLNTRATLGKDDFDLDEAFDAWRKGEFADLSQMMLGIVQSQPELAKAGTSAGLLPQFKATAQQGGGAGVGEGYGEVSRQMSAGAEAGGVYVVDQPVDMSQLNLGDGESPRDSGTGSLDAGHADFTFIPPDAKAYYRAVLKIALSHDLADEDVGPNEDGTPRLLSRQSVELLSEVGMRWRIPVFTRVVLFLDIVREKYEQQEIGLETVDAAFSAAKDPTALAQQVVEKRGSKTQTQVPAMTPLQERTKWTVADYALYQTTLSRLHDGILRELYELFQHCYEAKPPSIGVAMYVLETHILSDPIHHSSPEDMAAFAAMMSEALRQKARDKYHEILSKNISDTASEWEFFHVIQLGKAVTGLVEKVGKRYRKNPEVLGVAPLGILVEECLPCFADDGRELVTRIMALAKEGKVKGGEGDGKGESGAGKGAGEVPIQDGFELYKELVQIRRVWASVLPGREFGFHIEGLLQEFVWRWIAMTDAKLLSWIEAAVAHDDFSSRQDPKDKEAGLPPSEDERHSQSVIDVYQIFSQSLEQVQRLEWDDDLMYAKFMTAVSKSIGRGVARYCELLELKFAKEMDRQTPEQEMRAQQTQRDRWISAARDAWMSGGRAGEKIEPFQFYQESFVKINDVEFATLQLDKVEKEVNVDACAEVINRLDPPPPAHMRGRMGGGAGGGGQGKFMFTIKIIEAEDLKAGDANGLSDPYVVLGDEYQKRLAKTKTVYSSLNPRWDETVDILTTGPLNVVATVWDWDLVGDHDCLGRTSLKLDPSHFNDFLPREYWLDLDTQGRVLVRVSMEGERDDIQFYFGKAFRTLKRCERDMGRKVTDKLSAYILQCLSRRTLRALLGQNNMIGGVSMSQARGYFSKFSAQVAGRPMSGAAGGGSVEGTTPGGGGASGATPADVNNALKPLLQYFDDNFAIMKQTLTDSAMIMIMTRLWKEVLVVLESLLVPPLSDKISSQKPLGRQEVDIVYRWLQTLFDFFHAYDEEDKVANGVPLDVLKSPKYHDLQTMNFFYFDPTDSLIRVSDKIAQETAVRQQETVAKLNRLSAPASFAAGSSNQLLAGAVHGTRRTKSIMLSRNLGTMRQAKAAKRAEAQADHNDDMILRILRMRPEAERYLRDRSRQKERLAAAAAAEAIVRQSLMAGRMNGGFNGGTSALGPKRGVGAGAGGLSRRWDTIRE